MKPKAEDTEWEEEEEVDPFPILGGVTSGLTFIG